MKEKLQGILEAAELEVTPEKKSFADIVQESYKLLYEAKEAKNEEFVTLVQEHVAYMKANPNLEVLNYNLAALKAIQEAKIESLDEIVLHKKKPHRVKNFKLSRALKKAWTKGSVRTTILKALKKFRKSAQGKAFYKALGKFAAKARQNASKQWTLDEQFEVLKALSSMQTHLIIEAIDSEDFADNHFTDVMSVLHEDYTDLLESILTGQEPKSDLVESISTFSEALTSDFDSEEDPDYEDVE